MLRRVQGAPPTDPTEGVEVTIPNGDVRTTNTVTDIPGTGIWGYSLWAVYDERGTGTDERYSAVASITKNVGNAPTPTPSPTPTPTPRTPTPTPTVDVTADVILTWTPVSDRYDFSTYLCRRVSGSTPTTDPAGGTGITITNATTRTTSRLHDAPGGGTWSYSLFVVYDEYGDGTSLRYSLAATLTVDREATPTPTPSPTPTP